MIIVNNKMKKALESPVIWPVAGCIILYILICIVSGSVNARVITSGLKLCVFAMLLGVAQMIVVTSGKGAIDISQKYILTLAAYVSCELMQHNILLGLVAAIVVGMICGLINASVNVYLNIHAMITTMATGYLYYTVILLVSNKFANSPNSTFVKFTNANICGINTMTAIAILIAVILFFVLYRTKYGMNLHAVGQKREAARLAGINVNKTVINYCLCDQWCSLRTCRCVECCILRRCKSGSWYYIFSAVDCSLLCGRYKCSRW